MRSNESQVQNAFELIEAHDKRKVALLGLSFKAGTDDLRESPLVELAERLIGKGYQLDIYDENVQYARVHGANKDYIESKIPHVRRCSTPISRRSSTTPTSSSWATVTSSSAHLPSKRQLAST